MRVVGWSALLLGVGWTVLASAADRLAGQGLLTAPGMVGEGGRALTARAWLTLQEGRSSVTLARAAVRQRPTDAATLRVAGLTFLAVGDLVRADTLMRLAGAAGWRDQPTQLYWTRAALAAGDVEVAALRLDALMRANAFGPDVTALFVALERSPGGRAALARRVAAPGATWPPLMLERMEGLDADGMRARLATVVAARARLTRATLDAIGWSFVRAGAADLAERLLAPRDRLGFDPSADPTASGPFGWTLTAGAGLEAGFAGAGALAVRASGSAVLPLASRLLRRPPGPATLSVTVAGARTTLPLLATWACLDEADAPAAALPAPKGVARFAIATPVGCSTQRLTLLVSGDEAARGSSLRLSDVRISAGAAP